MPTETTKTKKEKKIAAESIEFLSILRSKLLVWYESNARDLPWRRTRDPYAIWVAEIMLQQTRVETVVPYYKKFLDQFPTVHTLAQSPLDHVLAAWSGLGYYRRARLLHSGAQYICDSHRGVIPMNAESLRSIPGVGAYTTGAIGSQAFDLELPLVDGNVARVFSRIFAIQTDVKKGEGLVKVWKLAAQIVQGQQPGKLNNALMELGATICIPKEPRCLICPVREECQARTLGLERELPIRTPKVERPRMYEAAVLLYKSGESNSKIVLAQRALGTSPGQEGLFAGMWEPPRLVCKSDRYRSPRSIRKKLSELLGTNIQLSTQPIGNVEHTLSHRTLDIQIYVGTVDSLPKKIPESTRVHYDRFEWLDSAQLHTRGISTLTRKILEHSRSISLFL